MRRSAKAILREFESLPYLAARPAVHRHGPRRRPVAAWNTPFAGISPPARVGERCPSSKGSVFRPLPGALFRSNPAQKGTGEGRFEPKTARNPHPGAPLETPKTGPDTPISKHRRSREPRKAKPRTSPNVRSIASTATAASTASAACNACVTCVTCAAEARREWASSPSASASPRACSGRARRGRRPGSPPPCSSA